MTTCHNPYGKKISVWKHTLEVVEHIDGVVSGGKKWEVSHITI